MQIKEIKIKEIDEIEILSKKDIGITKNKFQKILMELIDQIHTPENIKKGVKMSGPPIYRNLNNSNDPKEIFSQDPKEIIFEIGIPIDGKVMINNGFSIETLKGGKVASMTLIGPYNEITTEIYHKLYKYINDNNYSVNGPFREIYLSNPQDTPQDELITSIHVPIK